MALEHSEYHSVKEASTWICRRQGGSGGFLCSLAPRGLSGLLLRKVGLGLILAAIYFTVPR